MPEYCTCGAELPPDARFCHKCGKPQREEPRFEEEDERPAVVEPAAPAAPPSAAPSAAIPEEISFRNLAAVRVGFLSGMIASLLSSLPLPLVLCFIWLLASGFFSVYLYRRRTGHTLSVRDGVRIGWITGVFTFAISTILFTLSMVAVATSDQSFTALLREQLSERGFPQEMVDQAISVLLSPAGLIVTILLSLAVRFLSFAGITAVGGALGARVLAKD